MPLLRTDLKLLQNIPLCLKTFKGQLVHADAVCTLQRSNNKPIPPPPITVRKRHQFQPTAPRFDAHKAHLPDLDVHTREMASQ